MTDPFLDLNALRAARRWDAYDALLMALVRAAFPVLPPWRTDALYTFPWAARAACNKHRLR